MSFSSYLGWTLAGVAAVVAAPVTGGGSIAVMIGAAGTTTLAGAAMGAAGGASIAALLNQIFSDGGEEEKEKLRKTAEESKAREATSEKKRRDEAERHARDKQNWKAREQQHIADKEAMIAELKRQKIKAAEAETEVSLLFMLASIAAHENTNVSPDEWNKLAKSLSLLCANADAARHFGELYFASPATIADALPALQRCLDLHALARLAFMFKIVDYHGYRISSEDTKIFALFKEHAFLRGMYH